MADGRLSDPEPIGPDGKKDDHDSRPLQSPAPAQSWMSRLPGWVQEGLSTRSLKKLVRCWVCVWVSFLLILINPSLRVLGQAGFFGCIMAFIIPPYLPFAVYLIVIMMILIGSLVGWAWLVAGLAAAVRVRDQALLQQTGQRVQQEAAQSANPALYVQKAIFSGEFLDVRSTAVVGVFFILGCYTLAWIQVKRPKLKIMCVLASIVMDINALYGPLFPYGYYTFGELFLYPMLCTAAIALVVQCFIFPESASHAWQINLIKLCTLNKKLLDTHTQALDEIVRDPRARGTVGPRLTPSVRQMHTHMVMLMDEMKGQLALLNVDISFGHFTPGDLKRAFQAIQASTVRLFGLDTFMQLVASIYTAQEAETSGSVSEKPDKNDRKRHKKTDEKVTLAETHIFLHVQKDLSDHEEQRNVTMDSMLSVLGETCRAPLQAANDSCSTVTGWLETVAYHPHGKYDHSAWLTKLETTYEALNEALENFLKSDRMALIKPYEDLFIQDAHGVTTLVGEANNEFRDSARPLYVCFVFAANLTAYIQGLKELHSFIIDLARERPKRRLRIPSFGLRKVWHAVAGGPSESVSNSNPETNSPVAEDQYEGIQSDDHQDIDENDVETLNNEPAKTQPDLERNDDGARSQAKERTDAADEAEKKKRRQADRQNASKGKRDPDSLPPTKLIHHVGRAWSHSYRMLWSPEGIFALRYAILSFALWIPSMLPNCAFFLYQNKGIWALIMAQTILAMSSGEVMLSTVMRLAGTAGGLVVGMLLWYISCGNAALGNVYGLGAVTAVAFFPMVWLRISAPPIFILAAIMFNVTAVLIVSYSWTDTHLAQLVTSGKGAEVAWRRALLVLIGTVAALIVSIFPRPASTKRNVRKGLAKSTTQIAQVYTTTLEHWIEVEEGEESKPTGKEANHSDEKSSDAASSQSDNEKRRQAAIIASLRPRILFSRALLGSIQRDIGLTTFNISVSGAWPKDRYEELLDVHARLLQALSQMIGALLALHDERWRRKVLYTTATLDPLTISDTCVTLSLLANALQTGNPLPHAFTPLAETALHHQGMMRGIERVLAEHGGRQDLDGLTLDMLRDPQYMFYAAHISAYITFVRQLDRFRFVVSELVGEHSLNGFDAIKSRFDRRFVEARRAQ